MNWLVDDIMENVTLLSRFFNEVGGYGPTGEETHPNLRIPCLQKDCQLNTIHAGEMDIDDCELRNPAVGFHHREGLFSRLNSTTVISSGGKYDGQRRYNRTVIVNY